MRKNIFSNFFARAWGFVSAYLFVPLYLKFLGIEAYGLVGFYSTLVGVFAFTDMGFTAALNREMARLTVRKDSSGEMRDLLRTYEVAFLCISSVLAISIWALAPLIAEHWLRSQVLSPAEMSSAIRLMGVAIALQMPTGLYVGGLMGLQRQVRANALQMAWGAFRGIGAVLVLWLYAPTIFAFALWQLVSNAIYLLLARASLWRILPQGQVQPHPRFKWQVFRETGHYAAGMAGMAVVSTLLTQADKLTVSKMLSLEMLGYYTLAGTLASLPLMLASPIALAVFPRLTGMVEIKDRIGLTRLYHRTCELAAVAIIPAGLTLAFFAGDFIFAWTGSATTAHRVGLVASLLLGGQLMQALAVVPYYTALAHGDVKLYLYIGIASAILVTPMLIFLIMKYGVVGAGVSWLVVSFCALLCGVYCFHRSILPGELRRWCLRGVGLPILAALPCVLLGRWFMPHTSSRSLMICLIGLVWSLSAVATATTVLDLRNILIKHGCRFFRVSHGTP